MIGEKRKLNDDNGAIGKENEYFEHNIMRQSIEIAKFSNNALLNGQVNSNYYSLTHPCNHFLIVADTTTNKCPRLFPRIISIILNTYWPVYQAPVLTSYTDQVKSNGLAQRKEKETDPVKIKARLKQIQVQY